ncbi:MAG: hypothetical protein GXY83_25085 [Rhodopirellula sp.]|nr:hypothetical protein [Rhodopirellula sp.]
MNHVVEALVLLQCLVCQVETAPLAVWHFDEPSGLTVVDSSGGGLDGEIKGATRIAGKFHQALRFAGAHDSLQLPGPGTLAEGTIECWARLLKRPSGQVGVISFGAGIGGKNDAAILGLAPDDSQAATRWGFGVCHGLWQSALSDSEMPLGEWIHLAGSWGAAGLRFYVHGKLAASDETVKAALPDHRSILIAAGSWNTCMNVEVDEVRLYDRQLADAELASRTTDHAYVQTPPQASSGGSVGPRPVVHAADFYDPNSPSSGLQEAIDSLGRRGGIVEISPGTYYIERSLRLKSHTTLRGAGASTILKKRPEFVSPLTKPGRTGERSVEVRDASGFKPGTEIAVMDNQMRGWYMTHALIEKIDGNTITLDQALHKDMHLEHNALAITYFPAIWISQQSHCTVEGIRLDGDMPNQPSGAVTCFTLSAIHLHNCNHCQILDSRISGWPGDGIGVQGGRFNLVSGCTVTGARGHGFHPGTSIRDSVWTNLVGSDNGWDGLYFCAQCQGVLVSNSVFTDNGWSGIGGLGDGQDKYNTVLGNICRRNGRAGITMATSSHNTVIGNTCLDNSSSRAGHYPGILIADTSDNLISNNRCHNTDDVSSQKCGIAEQGSSDRNLISANFCSGHTQGGIVIVGPRTQSVGNAE